MDHEYNLSDNSKTSKRSHVVTVSKSLLNKIKKGIEIVKENEIVRISYNTKLNVKGIPKLTKREALMVLPVYMKGKIRREFNNLRIKSMTKLNDIANSYQDYLETHIKDRDRRLATKLQTKETRQRVARRKRDFLESLKAERLRKLDLQIDHFFDLGVGVFYGAKEGIEKTKDNAQFKAGNLLQKYQDIKEFKLQERDFRIADQLEEMERKNRTKQRKEDFKIALKEQRKEKLLNFKENAIQKVSSLKSRLTTLPLEGLRSVKTDFKFIKLEVMNINKEISEKYNAYRTRLIEDRDRRYAQKLIKDELRKQRKEALKYEKETRHSQIMDMLSELKLQQEYEEQEQKAMLAGLEDKLAYNIEDISEKGFRR